MPRSDVRKGTKAKSPASGARIALFVEGTSELTPKKRDDLAALWRFLCERVGANPHSIAVHGFTKQQLVLMDPPADVRVAGKIPFDVLVKLKHAEAPFDRLVVAFDALPENQSVLELPGGSCLASERDFLLRGLANSHVLPAPFRQSAEALLRHYAQHRGQARARTRPPLGDVEAIYMAPCFEAVVMADSTALRSVFSLQRVPSSWPRMPYRGRRPDFELAKIVDAHRNEGPPYLRQQYKERKHAWAQEIVRKAPIHSPVLSHPIAQRLGELMR
jgi:hypothetical protein